MRLSGIALLILASGCAPVVAPPQPAQFGRGAAIAPAPQVECEQQQAHRSIHAPSGAHPLLRKAAAAWTPPPPVPPPPPNAPAYLVGPEPVLQSTGDPKLDAYLAHVIREGGPGWRPYLLRAFEGLRAHRALLEASAALDPPCSSADYVSRFVTPERIDVGRRLYAQLQGDPLFKGEQRAPLEVLLALWGVLSDYGANPPRFDMIETLANLGANEKGPGWGYFDIYHAVQMLAEGRIERARAKAYSEGRIGQVRWLPSQYLQWGRDGDGDGKVDIWTSRADILANLDLRGWEGTAPILVEVVRPSFDRSDPRQRRMAEAIERGGPNVPASLLRRADGQPWPESPRSWGGSYVEPFGPTGPAYLLTRNHTPVNHANPLKPRYWDDASDPGFGIAVGLLADAIAGRPGPRRPIR